MKIKIKKLHLAAVIPSYAKKGDAGMDLYAVDMNWDEHGNFVYHTGLAMEIPEGYVGLVYPRSSISKTPHHLRNSVGVIDSGYRGEIMVKFGGNSHPSNYSVGDRVAQIVIMPYPLIEFVETERLSETERGQGGFGSTDEFEIEFSNGGSDE
jgi:dUTP pyrophosphatase